MRMKHRWQVHSVSVMSLFEKKTQLRYRANEGTLPHLDSSNSHLTIPSLEGLGDSRKRPLSTWTVLADHKHDVSNTKISTILSPLLPRCK